MALTPPELTQSDEFHLLIKGPNGEMGRKYPVGSRYHGYLVCQCPCGAFVLTNAPNCDGERCSTHSGAESQIVAALSPRH